MPENSFGDLNPEAMSDDMFSAIFGSDEPSEPEAEQEKPAKRIMAPASDKTSVLRNVPTVIVKIARLEFPDAKNNTDAVVAYLCCFCPGIMENNSLREMLTVDQKELIRSHPESSYTTTANRLLQLKKKMDKLSSEHQLLQVVTLYTLYDRLGLRESSFAADSLNGVDLEDNGRFLEFVEQMEAAAKALKARKAARDGRPLDF